MFLLSIRDKEYTVAKAMIKKERYDCNRVDKITIIVENKALNINPFLTFSDFFLRHWNIRIELQKKKRLPSRPLLNVCSIFGKIIMHDMLIHIISSEQ